MTVPMPFPNSRKEKNPDFSKIFKHSLKRSLDSLVISIILQQKQPYHPQVIHEAGAVLPDLGGLAGELSGSDVLATVQLLDRRHHSVYRIKEQS